MGIAPPTMLKQRISAGKHPYFDTEASALLRALDHVAVCASGHAALVGIKPHLTRPTDDPEAARQLLADLATASAEDSAEFLRLASLNNHTLQSILGTAGESLRLTAEAGIVSWPFTL